MVNQSHHTEDAFIRSLLDLSILARAGIRIMVVTPAFVMVRGIHEYSLSVVDWVNNDWFGDTSRKRKRKGEIIWILICRR